MTYKPYDETHRHYASPGVGFLFLVLLVAATLLFINVVSHEKRLDELERQSPKVVTEVTR